jgi:hypothetical protein
MWRPFVGFPARSLSQVVLSPVREGMANGGTPDASVEKDYMKFSV